MKAIRFHSRRWRRAVESTAVWAVLPFVASCGAPAGDPAEQFIARMSAAPPAARPPDWERTLRLMTRAAPHVGDLAPDFTLPALDGRSTLTRSAFQGDRPLVLIFGSFT